MLSLLLILAFTTRLCAAQPTHVRAVLQDKNIVAGTIKFADIDIAYKLYDIPRAADKKDKGGSAQSNWPKMMFFPSFFLLACVDDDEGPHAACLQRISPPLSSCTARNSQRVSGKSRAHWRRSGLRASGLSRLTCQVRPPAVGDNERTTTNAACRSAHALAYMRIAGEYPMTHVCAGFGKTRALPYSDNNMRAELLKTVLAFAETKVNSTLHLISPSMSG